MSGSAPAIDPVCGMSVDPVTATQKAEHDGTTYSFCGPGCRKAFMANPAKYLDASYRPHM